MFLSRAFASEIPTLQATSEMLLWSMVHCHSKGFIVLHGFTEVSRFLLFVCIWLMFHVQTHPVDLWCFHCEPLNTPKTVATCFAVRDFCKPQGILSVKCSLYISIEGPTCACSKVLKAWFLAEFHQGADRLQRSTGTCPICRSHIQCDAYCDAKWCLQDLRIVAKSTS